MAARTELDRLMAMDRGEGQEGTQRDSSWDANQINEHVYIGSEEAAHASKQEITFSHSCLRIWLAMSIPK